MSGQNQTPIILASHSPRRAHLLREAGIGFDLVVPDCEEPPPETWTGSPAAYAEAVSAMKAEAVAAKHPRRIVLGADTVVALDGRMFGKPADDDDARRILRCLAGTVQDVITGVTLMRVEPRRLLTRHALTRVSMRGMSEAELETYVASGQWEGKAGAYGIQDEGDPFVYLIEGSFSNVVGLPVELLPEMLAAFDANALPAGGDHTG